MIAESDLKEISPAELASSPSADHVQAGLPIAKAARIQTFSPDEWEAFVEEWATSLASSYERVRRFAGSGDQGVDIAGFLTERGFNDEWDNYQCKRYNHPLYPSDIWVEIGKIVYHSFIGEFNPPQHHYFIASKGIGTTLEQLLNNTPELKLQTLQNWADHCEAKITSTRTIPLSGDLLNYFDQFDFSIFKSKSQLELIDEHAKTNYHVVRFGGGLPLRAFLKNSHAAICASIRRVMEI